MKKKTFCWGILFLALAVLCIGRAGTVQAASYQKINLGEADKTVGGTTFSYAYSGGYYYLYATKDGTKNCLVKDSSLSSIMVTNGSTVFLSSVSYSSGKATVYRLKVSSGTVKKLFSVSMEDSFELCGYYSGKLYYIKELDPGTFCSYTISTGKKKTVAKNVTTAVQYKRYFYLEPYCGALYPHTMRIYNAKTGKKTTVTKKMYTYVRKGSYLYYVEFISSNAYSTPYKVRVRRCSLSGGSKKTLVKSLTVQYVTKLTSKSVTYVNSSGKKKTKKF